MKSKRGNIIDTQLPRLPNNKNKEINQIDNLTGQMNDMPIQSPDNKNIPWKKYFKSLDEELDQAYEKKLKFVKNSFNMYRDMYGDLNNIHESVKADHIAEKDAISKAFEAELSITKKEHAALKDTHDQLLGDFNAGDAEQFKRDLNKKIGDFESLIDDQKKHIKDLEAKLTSSSKLRKSMKADHIQHIAEKDAMKKSIEAEQNITKKEHAALKDMHDQLLADFNANNAEQFKRDLNKKIGDFESLIDDQEKHIKDLKAKFKSSIKLRNSMKTDLNKKIGDFESLIDDQAKQIKDLQAKFKSSINLRESMKAGHIDEKNAMTKNFEAEQSITKKDHTALKDVHDQLLADFNAGDAEQFKRDLDKKIADFEFLIDDQKNHIKDLQAKLKSSIKVRKSMKADHIAEKDAITKAFEAELNITKKEHAALKDTHDQLVADFNTGDAEQFKRNLNKKIGDFESLIGDQEKHIKDYMDHIEHMRKSYKNGPPDGKTMQALNKATDRAFKLLV